MCLFFLDFSIHGGIDVLHPEAHWVHILVLVLQMPIAVLYSGSSNNSGELLFCVCGKLQ